MYVLDKTLEIGNMAVYAEIEFEQEPLIPSNGIDPPEGGEIELIDVYVSLAVGDDYEVYRRDMEGWEEDLDRIAHQWVEDFVGLDELHDFADNYYL